MYRDINIAVGGPVNAEYPKVYQTKALKPNLPFALQVTEPNTKYVIKHKFDLGCKGSALSDVDFTDAQTHEVGGVTFYYVPIIANGNKYTLLDDSCVFVTSDWTGLSTRTITPEAGTRFMIGSVTGGLHEGAYTQAEMITMPESCILEFDGGSLDNGFIIGQDTLVINVGDVDIWGKNLIRRGTWREKQGGGIPDKEYDPEHFSGLGRKTLKLKNDGSNVLTQDDFDQENTVYVISCDFDLDDKEITIPDGCILEFEGGSLNNGTLIGSDTSIADTKEKIFVDNVSFGGTWMNSLVRPEWFGAKDDGLTDCKNAFEKAASFTAYSRHTTGLHRSCKTDVSIILNGGTYYLSETVEFLYPLSFNIIGKGSVLNFRKNADSVIHIVNIDHTENNSFNGNISDLVINGNGYDVSGIHIDFAFGTKIQNLDIQCCIGYGIKIDSGGEIVIKETTIGIPYTDILKCYTNSAKLKNNDYTGIEGVYAPSVSDSVMQNVFTQNIPIGFRIGDSWRCYNLHPWGAPRSITYNGDIVITYFTSLAIGIICNSNNFFTACYADTCLKQDASKDHTETVNGIMNGGIGLYVKYNKNVILGFQTYVNASIIPQDFAISEDNYAVYFGSNSYNNTLVSCNNPAGYYPNPIGGPHANDYSNTVIMSGSAPTSLVGDSARNITDLVSLLRWAFFDDTGEYRCVFNFSNIEALKTARFGLTAHNASFLDIYSKYDAESVENGEEVEIWIGKDTVQRGGLRTRGGVWILPNIWLQDNRGFSNKKQLEIHWDYNSDDHEEYPDVENPNIIAKVVDEENTAQHYHTRLLYGWPEHDHGNASNREDVTNPRMPIGQRYFDTELKKPIYKLSSKLGWVDANGNPVSVYWKTLGILDPSSTLFNGHQVVVTESEYTSSWEGWTNSQGNSVHLTEFLINGVPFVEDDVVWIELVEIERNIQYNMRFLDGNNVELPAIIDDSGGKTYNVNSNIVCIPAQTNPAKLRIRIACDVMQFQGKIKIYKRI